MTKPTWIYYKSATQGRLAKADRDSLPTTPYAFPHSRKEPITDASHIRDAMSRFDQVKGVTDSERDIAFSTFFVKFTLLFFKVESFSCHFTPSFFS